MIQYAGGFLFCNQSVALCLKSKPDWQRGKLNCVGGKIETELNETPIQAMTREFYEETKLITSEFDWFHKLTLTGEGWRVYFFAAFWHELCKLEGTKEEPVHWYNVDKLPSNVIPNLYWMIPLCLDKDIVTPVSFIDKRGMDYGRHKPVDLKEQR